MISKIIMVCCVALLFVASCGDNPTGVIVENSGCKRSSSSTSCVEYAFENGKLYLKNFDAGFNCCPENISADIQVTDDTVYITAVEVYGSAGPCSCLCLYDVEYEIDDLAPGEYLITIEDAATDSTDELLQFIVDLSREPSGVYCVDRCCYPWNMDKN
jgi:hypothetical protein